MAAVLPEKGGFYELRNLYAWSDSGNTFLPAERRFLQPDEYSEIKAKYFLPGGETGTAATVLASLGASVKIDGTHIGTEVAQLPLHPPTMEEVAALMQ